MNIDMVDIHNPGNFEYLYKKKQCNSSNLLPVESNNNSS